jgi:hypothetical protein
MEVNPIKTAHPTHIREFNDDSKIIYYDDGTVYICTIPSNAFEEGPHLPPKAELYYWQVIEGRPDVKTRDDIKKARKAERER